MCGLLFTGGTQSQAWTSKGSSAIKPRNLLGLLNSLTKGEQRDKKQELKLSSNTIIRLLTEEGKYVERASTENSTLNDYVHLVF